MLILAGVAIATLFNDDGIINRTISAKNSTDIAEAKEELELAVGALKIDKISSNVGGTVLEYVLSHQTEFSKALGNNADINLQNIENGIITYKGKSFTISEDGKIAVQNTTDDTQQQEEPETVVSSNPIIFTYNVLTQPQNGQPGTAEITYLNISAIDEAWEPVCQEVGYEEALVSLANTDSKIIIPSKVKLTSDGNSYFYDPDSDTEYTITRIGEDALGCPHDDEQRQLLMSGVITEIILPDSITWIGDGAFADTSASKINIPKGVTHIGEYAFCGSRNKKCKYSTHID